MTLRDRLASQPTADAVPPSLGGRWRTPLRLAVATLFLAVIAVVLAGQWRQARPLLGRLPVPVVLAAWAPVLAGIYATFRSWRAALADLGGSLPHAGAMRVFYLGQLGKYLPGTIWPAVTQMRLGRDYRVPPRASGAAFVVFMLVLVGTGLLVGLPVVPLLGRDAVDEYRWLVLVLPLFALALTPPLLNRAVAVALRAIRRPPLPAPLSLTGVLRVAGWAVLSWLCYGAHVFLLARRLGTDGGALLWLQCTGAFAAAFASGPLLLVMPAGAGVREAALLLLLGSTVTVPVAAVVAVTSRLLFIVGDVAWSAVAVLAVRRQGGQGHRPQRLEVELALEQGHQLAEQRQPAPPEAAATSTHPGLLTPATYPSAGRPASIRAGCRALPQNDRVLLDEIAGTSAAVAASPARLAKVERLAACLRRLEPGEVHPAVAFLSGELRQRQIGVGWAALRDAPDPAAASTLTVAEVDAAFERIGRQAGPGSQAERRRLLHELFGRATAAEQRFLVGLLSGELRQGALEGVMAEAIAKAAGVPSAEVRRAVMLRGALGPVAEAALSRGVPGLREFHLRVGRPLQPMLASTAPSIEAAMQRVGEAAVEWKLDGTSDPKRKAAARGGQAAVEWKLDGVRVQLHKAGDEVRVFTRTLDDVTARVPEVVEMVLALPVRSAVLDGELIALQPDGRPHPFQVTAGRLGSKLDMERQRLAVPLTLYLFDALHVDGEDLIDRGGVERHAALAAVTPTTLRVPRRVTGDPAAAAAFLADALARGHEGVLVKSLTAPYEAGRRGTGWLKVKPVHTLDLVVLAVEWGHGRRKGWLSNLHLGARDPETGGYVMLGKTFKGLTDKLLAWQTERLLELAVGPADQWVVQVRPELVVEVAFDGVQASPRYPGGVALRFARVLRYRPDKRPEEADTIGAVRAIHAGTPQRGGDAAG